MINHQREQYIQDNVIRRLRAISNCNLALLHAEDEQSLLDDICRIICDEAGYYMAWVGYAEHDDARSVTPRSWAGAEQGYLSHNKLTWADTTAGHRPMGMAIRSGGTTYAQDLTRESESEAWAEQALSRGLSSAIALPLKNEMASTFGVLCIYSEHKQAFTPDEIRLLEELAGNLAFGITSLRLRDKKKEAERQLVASEQLFRTLVENSPNFIARYDLQLRRIYINPALRRQFGVPYEETIGTTPATQSPLLEPERYMASIRRAIETATEFSDDFAYRQLDGEMHWSTMRFAPEFGADGRVETVLVIAQDITRHIQAEEERKVHLHFLQSLDRINRILQEEGDIRQIMQKAMDEVLDIFDCDRVFLLYPCDPNMPTWSIPIESTKPEYPGAFQQGREVPMDEYVAWTLRLLLESEHPVKLGAGTDYPLSRFLTEEFSIRSFMSMVLYPRVDKPWQLGIHQCSHDRIWTKQETRLFEEIGHRLSEGLNSLLITRDLRASEERFRQVFENSPVPVREEDYSAVKLRLEALRPDFGDDIEGYLSDHPELVDECAALVRIIDINQAALVFHEADSKEKVLRELPQIFVPETADAMRRVLATLMRGETELRLETELQTLTGRRQNVAVYISVSSGYEQSLRRVLVSLIDITDRKRAEQVRQDHVLLLQSLDRVNRVLQEEGDIGKIMQRALDEVLDIFECDRVYLVYPCDPDSPTWSVPIESSRPEYPGAHQFGTIFPQDDHITWAMGRLLASDHPLLLGAGTEHPVPDPLRENYSIRSFMGMALYPKGDKPWQFGLHQCSYDRIWTEQETRLFEEIGHRLADSLSNLLITRDLRASEERFRLVFENSPIPIWEEDFSAVKSRLNELQGVCGDNIEDYLEAHPEVVRECAELVRIISVNHAALELHEADSKETLLSSLSQTFLPESFDAFRRELVALTQGQLELSFDSVVQTLTGKRREVNVYFTVCPGFERSLTRILVSLINITERKQAEDQLRLAASVFANSQEGIMISDAENRIIDVNPAFTHLTGYTRDEALGRNPRFLSAGHQKSSFYDDMWQSIKTTGEWQGELWNQRKSGEVYAELLSIVAVKDGQGRLQHYVGSFYDISMIKQHEADLDRIAHYDTLTSVPNRRLLQNRLEQAIAHARRFGKSLAVCYLDLDGFKPINDEFGHESGDRLLVEVAQRLESLSRADDTVARLGGDEFVLLWNDIEDQAHCIQALERVLSMVSEPMLLNDVPVSVSGSIGVTLYPDDNVDADSLIRHADHAMYTAKQLGKNRFQIFDARLERQISARGELLAKVSRGLDQGQFELYYQPKVDCVTGTVHGVEALLRWSDPVLGLVGPKEFLSLIENESLAFRMGRWVMERAVRQARIWHDMGITLPISINVFPRHLKYKTFIDDLHQAVKLNWPQMPAKRLLMEIIESSDLEELEPIEQVIKECLKMGIGFSLDDFGTGYSSLVYLQRLSIEELKIDQSFIRDMLEDPNDQAIVVGVIGLGKAFGLRVVAEGVESIEQARHLVNLGCTIAQGYGLGRPMPAETFQDWYADILDTGLKI